MVRSALYFKLYPYFLFVTLANGLATKTTYTDTTCTTGASAETLTVGDCTAAGGGQYMKAVGCGSDATAFDTKFILNS
jgi:hypothetical protein